jgi:hypothetical protein
VSVLGFWNRVHAGLQNLQSATDAKRLFRLQSRARPSHCTC